MTTELLNPGILYVALSHSKTIGTVTPNILHPKDSAIFWTGSGMCLTRVLNITQKKGLDGNMTNCLKVEKRQKWVEHLIERNHVTTSQQYQKKRMKKIKKKIPNNIQQMEDLDLQKAIATMITEPNETWKRIRGEKYMVPRSYFKNN